MVPKGWRMMFSMLACNGDRWRIYKKMHLSCHHLDTICHPDSSYITTKLYGISTCHHHHHWAAVVSRGWTKASACRLQVSLSCAVLYQMVPLQYFSRSSLHLLGGLPCHLFLSYGLQVVTRDIHRSSLRRLICPAQDHFIFLSLLINLYLLLLSFPDPDVGLSIPYVMLSILLSIWSWRALLCGDQQVFSTVVKLIRSLVQYVTSIMVTVRIF